MNMELFLIKTSAAYRLTLNVNKTHYTIYFLSVSIKS